MYLNFLDETALGQLCLFMRVSPLPGAGCSLPMPQEKTSPWERLGMGLPVKPIESLQELNISDEVMVIPADDQPKCQRM